MLLYVEVGLWWRCAQGVLLEGEGGARRPEQLISAVEVGDPSVNNNVEYLTAYLKL